MAKTYTVSLCEKKLIEWVDEQKGKGKLSPSLVFRDAMTEKKREWEITNSENPVTLHKQINILKKQIGRFSEFLQQNKEIDKKYFDFLDSHPINFNDKKQIVQVPQ